MAFDFRIVRVTLEDEQQTDVFENIAITVVGQTTASWIQNQCNVTLFNVEETIRNRLATKYTPDNLLRRSPGGQFFRLDRGIVTIEVGRESTETFVLFKGSVSTIALSNPPDIALILNIIGKYFGKSDIISKNFGEKAFISDITNNVAESLDLSPQFNATDKEIMNAYYSGDLVGQVRMISDFGYIQATIDGDQLVVMDDEKERDTTAEILEINVKTGMIGIPNWNESGLYFRVLITPQLKVGSIVRVNSIINPAVNDGLFKVVNLLFNVTNRDNPFYYDAFCTRFS